MSILLANHADIYNRRLTLKLLELGLPIRTVITADPSFFDNIPLPAEIEVRDIYDFYYSDRLEKLTLQLLPALSAEEIIGFFELESLFLRISDRLNFFSLSVHKRLDLYYLLLAYWLNYFRTEKIKLVVFSQTPHTGYDNIIYYVAKKLGIPTLVIIPTSIGTSCFLQADYYQPPQAPKNFNRNQSAKQLERKIKPKLLADAYGDGAWRKTGKDINTQVLANNKSSIWLRTTYRCGRSLLKNPIQQMTRLLGRSRNSGLVFGPPLKYWQELLLTIKYYSQRRNLMNGYQQLAKLVSLRKKYVYFALHYQPERTTLPEGNIFENQYLAIKILSQALPQGWQLYVKEHPREFSLNDIRTRHFRDEHYYQQIGALPKVVLVPIETDSQQLIDKAQFTASIQGTVGWESLTRHRPTMVFAPAWYNGCDSAFLVTSVFECQKAIKIIKKKSPSLVELDLLRFLLYVQKQLVPAAFYERQARRSDLKYKDQLISLATAIQQYYEKQTVTSVRSQKNPGHWRH